MWLLRTSSVGKPYLPFTGRKAFRIGLSARYGERPKRQLMSRSNHELGGGGIATNPSIADNYWEGLKVSYSMKNWENHIRNKDE